MVRIAVHGATGRLGSLIAEQAGDRYVGPVPRGGPVPRCDVVVDVTTPEGTAALLPLLDGEALVVGTTGELPMEAIEEYARIAPVAVVPNFSAGVPLMLELVERMARCLPPDWQVEIVEAHHAAKRDAPSGTARRLARALGRTSVPVHSLRIGDTVGEHTVIFAGPGERIEVRHVATRREVFAIGAVRWAERIAEMPPGLLLP